MTFGILIDAAALRDLLATGRGAEKPPCSTAGST